MRVYNHSQVVSIIEAEHQGEFELAKDMIRRQLACAPLIHRGRVHAQDVSHRPEMATYELSNVNVVYPMPSTPEAATTAMSPNLPWAEDHFTERVSSQPLNPAPSHHWWPYNQAGNAAHTNDTGQFSHTYPERMWPKHAGHDAGNCGQPSHDVPCLYGPHTGIRYGYGDLHDVVRQLSNDPFTRQAFLPIWFPEDTGAVDGQRVPCSLGYHFIRRGTGLDCQYFLRSCDFFRHFTDDAYLAVRLTQWVCRALGWSVYPGRLTIFMSNLHAFAGDKPRLDTI